MTSLLSALLVVAGSAFALIAAIGMLRMPDLPMRMHAATKAGTLGVGLLLLAPAVASAESSVLIRSSAGIVFLFLTAPVAAHLIGRAACLAGGMRLWEGTLVDEWQRRDREAPPLEPPPRPSPDPERRGAAAP